MKTTLSIENLEQRFALSAYTVEILDRHNLVPAGVEQQMRDASHFVMRNLAEFVNWKGTLDLRIDVRPPTKDYGDFDGITPAIMSMVPSTRRNATLQEMITGIDPYPDQPDVGMFVHLGNDGTVKLYGMKVYFDPDPMTYVPARVPDGHFDFIGVLNHEVAHGVGFQLGTVDFSRHVTESNGFKFFVGRNTVQTFGRTLPLSTFGGTHYGNYLLVDNPILSGLMYQWGNYGGNRFDWGKVDLAVLRDLGLTTKNESRIPLLDTIDRDVARPIVSQSFVYENSRIGTTVATISMSDRSTGYSFSVVGPDADNFSIVGNRLVTRRPIDFETKDSHSIRVRAVDQTLWRMPGVWVENPVVISVRDVREPPTLGLPPHLALVNGFGNLGGISVLGDRKNVVTFVVFSRTGTLSSSVNESGLLAYVIKNKAGGTTLIMRGTADAITRNLRNVSYRGSEASLSIQMAHNNRNVADVKVPLLSTSSRPVPARVFATI